MFSHHATRKISPICKISTFSKDLSFLSPRSHLKSGTNYIEFFNFKLQSEVRLLIGRRQCSLIQIKKQLYGMNLNKFCENMSDPF